MIVGNMGCLEVFDYTVMGDAVNLVDLDNGGNGTWAQTAAGGGSTTYDYSGGSVDATVTIDDALTVILNTNTFDGL